MVKTTLNSPHPHLKSVYKIIYRQSGYLSEDSYISASSLSGNHSSGLFTSWGFPGGSNGKEPTANEGDTRDAGLTPRSGKSPGGRSGNPLQYSCLENPMDRGAWWATVYRIAESDMTKVA